MMLRAWWRQWTGLEEAEGRIDALRAEVEASRRAVARERSRIQQFHEAVVEKEAEIERLIREVGALERQLRDLGADPVTHEGERTGLASFGPRRPADDPVRPPQYASFRAAAEALVAQPEQVRAVVDEWWRNHPRPKPTATP